MNMKYECWTYVNGKPDKMTTCPVSPRYGCQVQEVKVIA